MLNYIGGGGGDSIFTIIKGCVMVATIVDKFVHTIGNTFKNNNI